MIKEGQWQTPGKVLASIFNELSVEDGIPAVDIEDFQPEAMQVFERAALRFLKTMVPGIVQQNNDLTVANNIYLTRYREMAEQLKQ